MFAPVLVAPSSATENREAKLARRLLNPREYENWRAGRLVRYVLFFVGAVAFAVRGFLAGSSKGLGMGVSGVAIAAGVAFFVWLDLTVKR